MTTTATPDVSKLAQEAVDTLALADRWAREPLPPLTRDEALATFNTRNPELRERLLAHFKADGTHRLKVLLAAHAACEEARKQFQTGDAAGAEAAL